MESRNKREGRYSGKIWGHTTRKVLNNGYYVMDRDYLRHAHRAGGIGGLREFARTAYINRKLTLSRKKPVQRTRQQVIDAYRAIHA